MCIAAEHIGIYKVQGNSYISAIELYNFLEPGKRFVTWFRKMAEHGFVEDEDYHWTTYTATKEGGGFKKVTDYYLTIETAKEIATIQNTDLGRHVRVWLKTVKCNALSMDEMIDLVEAVYSTAYDDYEFTPKFRLSVENFIKALGHEQVVENMKLSCRVVYNNASKVLKYFCGICWNHIKDE